MPASASIYYISPESLKYLYEDFQEKDIYFSINLLLNQEATQQIMKELGARENVMERLASFGELHIPCRFMGERLALLSNSH